MKGLLLRLSALDADAENAVRVISFFDGLIAGRADLHTLVQETARLAECPAGLLDPATGLSLRAVPTDASRHAASRSAERAGVRVPHMTEAADDQSVSEPVPEKGVRRLARELIVRSSQVSESVAMADWGVQVRPGSEGGFVWLERGGVPLALDEIVLERFAIAASVILDGMPQRGDAGLVELVLSPDAGEVERSRALRLLQVEPDAVLHVLAVAPGDGPVAAVRDALQDAGPHMASLGRMHAVLTRSVPPDLGERLPGGVRVGVAEAVAAIEAPGAWERACTALRFAGAEAKVVHHDELGALAVIAARMRDEDIAQVADVAALDRLAAEPGTLDVLTAFCATGSARRAATRVHRHHSTVAARLAHAEARLGFSFSGPGGRLRLDLALLLRRLRDNPA